MFGLLMSGEEKCICHREDRKAYLLRCFWLQVTKSQFKFVSSVRTLIISCDCKSSRYGSLTVGSINWGAVVFKKWLWHPSHWPQPQGGYEMCAVVLGVISRHFSNQKKKGDLLFHVFLGVEKKMDLRSPQDGFPSCLIGQNWITRSPLNQSLAKETGLPY